MSSLSNRVISGDRSGFVRLTRVFPSLKRSGDLSGVQDSSRKHGTVLASGVLVAGGFETGVRGRVSLTEKTVMISGLVARAISPVDELAE